jgi:putative cardiolipin synthase
MEWTDHWRFVSDDPDKVTRAGSHGDASRVVGVLIRAAEEARESIAVISPYFVPGEIGTEVLQSAVRVGCRVEVLTNSLVANDVAAVHGGYTRYRTRLLRGGVGLWELKPLGGRQVPSHALTARASLHTKALAIDGRTLFVGSYNLDPRSRFLNCEQGIMARSGALTEQLEAIFREQTSGSHAWQVRLRSGGGLEWSDGQSRYEDEPGASLSRKLQAWLARVLPVEAQL